MTMVSSEHGGHAHGHSHGVDPDADGRWLRGALALIVLYMAAEVAVGIAAHSLALLSDAAHMLTDAVALALALLAARLAARPARGSFTFGLKRAEILSAQANGAALLVLSSWLTYASIRRLIWPSAVTGGAVLATALVGVAVNLAATWMVGRADRSSLNVKGAYQHVLTDLYGFIATAIAAVVILTAHFPRADAIASLVVVALMLRAGVGLIRESGLIFLEAAPAGVDPDALGDRLVAVDDVIEIHDLHVWLITSGQPALSAHVLVEPGRDCHAVRRALESLLADAYHITHTTLQVDHAPAGRLPQADEEHCEGSHGPFHRVGEHPH